MAAQDYLFVLRAVSEIPFPVGRNLLSDFLLGVASDPVRRNRLDRLPGFGSLSCSKDELEQLLDLLVSRRLLEVSSLEGKKFWKVLALTGRGRRELGSPGLELQQPVYRDWKTIITDGDRAVFQQLSFFLGGFNDEQKKAIICSRGNVLCVAGAGSGKTTVLVKRIEFLVRFKSVPPSSILAITFTRKARQEMASRLAALGVQGVHVETFNSFCEKLLQRHADVAYGRHVRVVDYGDRVRLVRRALSELGTSMESAVGVYFSSAQKKSKTVEQLASIFVNDCFFLRDFFKMKGISFARDFAADEDARLAFDVSRLVDSYMAKFGLRDFSDQLVDCLRLFSQHPGLIPSFRHVLVDEYQDVNSAQVELIGVLKPPCLFAVGDPRQAIYGWRGSDIRFILDFEKAHQDCEVISLTKNYRSTGHIVDLVNKCICSMGLPDLIAERQGLKEVALLDFENEDAEFAFVCRRILECGIPRGSIFALARTNRQLSELSAAMSAHGISHVVRSDELRSSASASPDDVTLATVHAIKGLEAQLVFVVGCSSSNFPCRAAEHPAIEALGLEDYDKDEEERRLLYVALSRARDKLYVSYSGRVSEFVSSSMKVLLGRSVDSKLIRHSPASPAPAPKLSGSADSKVFLRLREWRSSISRKLNVPAYVILPDRSLMDIVHRQPINEEDLEGIYGLGPVKIRKYGRDILSVIHSHSRSGAGSSESFK